MAHGKVCEHCGSGFTSRRSDARFCGQRCSYGSRRGRAPVAECGGCGVDISDRHGNAKYCQACYTGRVREHGLSDLKCPECGDGFRAPKSQKYCSSKCSGRAARRSQLSLQRQVECKACGVEFRTRDARVTTCSVACRQWSHKYPGHVRLLVRRCLQCGGEFTDPHLKRKYCSQRCSKYSNKVRRRAMIKSAFVEDVSVAQLLERDGGDCQLCWTPIDFDAKWPERLSVVIDHAIPLSLGGKHSLGNTQLAHAVCNSAKGNRLVFVSEVMPSCQIQRRETSLPHT